MADLYRLLGVPRDADQDEIKRAYRRKARELHPDAGGDEEAFKEVTRAYEVLSNPELRARYDRYGEEGVRGAGVRGGDPFAGGFGGIEDVINAFFGGGDPFGTARTRTRRDVSGRDVLVGVELDLEEVATGTTRQVEVDVAVACQACDASGSSSGSGPTRCSTCGGSGQVRRVVRSAFGQLATSRPCPDCGGSGVAVGDPCEVCDGGGRVRDRRTLSVEIPTGVETGDRLRLAGQGEAGQRGASSGDLYVEVQVRPHDVFTREDRDLWCDVSVPFVHAALGATLEVPTIRGDTVAVDLPAGTQPGEVLTVRREGIPRRGGHDPGDMKVRVDVEIPQRLSLEEEELLRRFAELRGEQAPPSGKGLFRRLREAFR